MWITTGTFILPETLNWESILEPALLSPALSYLSCDGPGVCGYDLHDGEGVAWRQEGKYSTTLFTQRARKILESHDPTERPLFLLLSLQVPTELKLEEKLTKHQPLILVIEFL